MAKICGACKNGVCDDDLVVICEGFCEGIRRFHARCVNLTEEECNTCHHSNIMWMCDNCRDLMENVKFRNTVNAVRPTKADIPTVESLKSEVLKITENLSKLTEKLCCTQNHANEPQDNNQRTLTAIPPPLSSTAIELAERPEAHRNDSSFKLHLSNIATDVTTDEVLEMVSDSLGTCDIMSVRRLVPEWRDTSTLDFVSFKIELNQKHRTAALTLSNWPNGVKCREFKERLPTVWRPANRSRTN